MAQHAPAIGLSQGQLRGAVTNLGSIVSIFAGLVWPRIYAVGVRIGRPGLFYLPIALVAALQLLIVRTEMGTKVATSSREANTSEQQSETGAT